VAAKCTRVSEFPCIAQRHSASQLRPHRASCSCVGRRSSQRSTAHSVPLLSRECELAALVLMQRAHSAGACAVPVLVLPRALIAFGAPRHGVAALLVCGVLVGGD
jgi:hypothetical protein